MAAGRLARGLARGFLGLSYYLGMYGLSGPLRMAGDLARDAALPRGRVFGVDGGGLGPVRLRAGGSDLAVFRQVAMRREYDPPAPFDDWLARRQAALLAAGRRPVIVDGGANIGLFARAAAQRFPEARVIAVEPDAANLALARENGAGLANLDFVEAGLGPADGRIWLQNPGAAAWALSFAATPPPGETGPGIDCRSVDSLLEDVPDAALLLLKLDIEGAERDLLAAPGRFWADLPAVFVEPHDTLPGGGGSLAGLLARPAYAGADIVLRGENLMLFPGAPEAAGAEGRRTCA